VDEASRYGKAASLKATECYVTKRLSTTMLNECFQELVDGTIGYR